MAEVTYCELPDEPDFNTVFLYEQFAFLPSYKRENYLALRSNLESWETIFFLPFPEVSPPGPDRLLLEAEVFWSKDGGFKWSKQWAKVENGTLSIYENQSASKPLSTEKMHFTFFYEQFLLILDQPPYFPPFPLMRFFTERNGVYDFRFIDKKTCQEWDKALIKYWKSIFSADHFIALSDTVRAYIPIIQKLKDLCLEKYSNYHSWFLGHRSNKFSKIFAGHLKLIKDDGTVIQDVEAELYKGCLVMDVLQHQTTPKKGNPSEAGTTPPTDQNTNGAAHTGKEHKRIRYDYLLLRFLHILDEGQPLRFKMVAPNKTLLIETKSQSSKATWLSYFKEASTTSRSNTSRRDLLNDDFPSSDERYNHTSSLDDESTSTAGSTGFPSDIVPVHQTLFLHHVPSQFFFKINKGMTTIGRSRSNNICIKEEKISRFHARIEVIKNTPYLVDLGSIRGVKINGVTTQRGSFRIGDTITLGQTDLLVVNRTTTPTSIKKSSDK